MAKKPSQKTSEDTMMDADTSLLVDSENVDNASSKSKSASKKKRKSGRRHPMALTAIILLGLLVTGGLYSTFTAVNEAQAASSVELSEDDVDAGNKLFLSNCASCHGINATGTAQGPNLVGVGAAAVDFQVGTGRMPMALTGPQAERKPPQFNEKQRHQLAAYVASLGAGPEIPDLKQIEAELESSGSDVSTTKGGELFRVNCAMCHNAVGSGGALTNGKFAPSLSGVDGTYVYEAMATGPQAMPIFNDNNISPQEKLEIISYLQTADKQGSPGGFKLEALGPVAEGWFIWVFGLAIIIGFTVWITKRSS